MAAMAAIAIAAAMGSGVGINFAVAIAIVGGVIMAVAVARGMFSWALVLAFCCIM
ncbi:hypothetical protein JCM17846_30970 [Iodidimonas nitroreducens]|uniref:Uncharacterized protein n=1 Tax=Iodidimonas nitroreducens TaxID=1236968 RepID=A0A5A7NCR6_9PROT|nr:hypothetical protein JCM17846_30970 [Iodidimonas nitroreducens]